MMLIITATIAFFVLCYIIAGLRIVNEWEEGLLFTLGKYSGRRRPGLNWVFAGFQRICAVDKRVRTLDVKPQECITSDSVTVELDAVIYYKVVDPMKAVINVADFMKASSKLGQTALRDVVGQETLDNLLQNKEALGIRVMKMIQAPTDSWGVEISNVEIKDVTLPKDMKRAMAKEAEAIREKRARITKADGEFEASKKLAQASKMMSDNAMILRQLQTWQEIGAEQNSTMILVPSDLISKLKK